LQPCDRRPPREVSSLVSVLMERPVSVGVQVPRVHSVPPYVSTRGHEAIEVAASASLILDPFQELALIDGCGCRADGKWSAFEAVLEISRQNGKGGVFEARELAGIFAWGERLILHSAHEFQTATEAMLRMEEILAGTPEFASQVKSVSRSHGSEGFIFKSGQRLRYRTRTKGGGRGFTGDTLILDEAMELPEKFVGALLPTLSGRSVTGNPQVWYGGSAVDQLVHENGTVFARLRLRALEGGDPSLAYFGWSALPAVDEDGKPVTPDHVDAELLGDREAWANANPGLGIRISEEHVEKELRSLDDRTFAVERLGVGDWPDITSTGASPISYDAWKALADTDSSIVGAPVFAFDVTPERSWASISAAGLRPDGLSHVEVIDRRQGLEWLVDRVVELKTNHRALAVVCDGASPAASFVRELGERGVVVQVLNASDNAKACGKIFDQVTEQKLRHLGSGELSSAIKGAAKRPLGDAWAWSRKKATYDISPLVSCTLALWVALEAPAPVYMAAGF
jgi:hypothetical protein